MNKRIEWDLYYMNIAVSVSLRATCDRKHVGAVIVSASNSIVATGYNGAVSGELHCDDIGHDLVNNSCQRVVHSEINAVAQAANRGASLRGSTLYVTASPCWPCFRTLVHAGVRTIVYGEEFYRDFDRIKEVSDNRGMLLKFCDVRNTPMALYNAAVAAAKDDSAAEQLSLSFTRVVTDQLPFAKLRGIKSHLKLVKNEDEPK